MWAKIVRFFQDLGRFEFPEIQFMEQPPAPKPDKVDEPKYK
jgi:hypothetical protein